MSYSKLLLDEVWATRPERGHGHEKDSPSAPPPPDYTGAAKAQGAANVQTAITEGVLNRPNQITPQGNLTYNQTGTFTVPGAEGSPPVEVPQFTATTSLTPEAQKQFEQQQRISGDISNVAEGAVNRVGGQLGTPFDMSKIPDIGVQPGVAGQEAVTQALIQRQQPYFDQAREQGENQLLTRGHNPGGTAWNAKELNLSQAENDARLAAVQAGGAEQSRLFGLGTQARQQAIQEQSYLRNLPLNEVNALRTGSPVAMPQFQNAAQTQIAPTPLLQAANAQYGAANNLYNTQVGQANAANSGLYGLGGAVISALPYFL